MATGVDLIQRPREHALGLGAALGLLLALASVLRLGPAVGGLPEGAAALVGETAIAEASVQRAERALLTDSNLTPQQARATALDRLIDEELAVQRGLELGIATQDPRVRALLVEAVIDHVETRAEDEGAPTEAQLRALFAREPGRFSVDRRVHVRELLFVGADAEHRAQAARRALVAGLSAAGDRPSLLPDALLPQSKLRDYLGDSPSRAVSTLRAGEVSGVVKTPSATHVLVLIDAQGGVAPSYEEAREAVEAQWRRDRVDVALREFLGDLRGRTRILR